jgi:hypothetical protein
VWRAATASDLVLHDLDDGDVSRKAPHAVKGEMCCNRNQGTLEELPLRSRRLGSRLQTRIRLDGDRL